MSRSAPPTYKTSHTFVVSVHDFLPIEFVAMGNSNVDRFGRATEQAGCTLHLRGVLVGVKLALEPELTVSMGEVVLDLLEPKGWEGANVTMSIDWDTWEERELAASSDVDSFQVLM